MGLLVSVLVAAWMLLCVLCGFRQNLTGFLIALVAGLVPLATVLGSVLGAGPGEIVFIQSLVSAFLFAVASGLTGRLLARLKLRNGA